MKSGRGGQRKNAGRKPTGKGKRVNPTLSKANTEWFEDCEESASELVNRLIDKERLAYT